MKAYATTMVESFREFRDLERTRIMTTVMHLKKQVALTTLTVTITLNSKKCT